MAAVDVNGHELKAGHLVRRVTVDKPEDTRAWGGYRDLDERLGGNYLGVVEHVVGHAVVTETGVYCGRLVVRT